MSVSVSFTGWPVLRPETASSVVAYSAARISYVKCFQIFWPDSDLLLQHPNPRSMSGSPPHFRYAVSYSLTAN